MFAGSLKQDVAIFLGLLYAWILLPSAIFHDHADHAVAECHAGDHADRSGPQASLEAICEICDGSSQKAVQLDLAVPALVRIALGHVWTMEFVPVPDLRVHRIGDRGPPALA